MKNIKRERGLLKVSTIEEEIGFKYNELNSSDESRIVTATVVAAISRGNDSAKKPKDRFEKLLVEAAPNLPLKKIVDNTIVSYEIHSKAGRPIEFIPVRINEKNNKLIDLNYQLSDSDFKRLLRFSYIERVDDSSNSSILYTNLRALINETGLILSDVVNTPTDGYFIVKVSAPYFVFAQLRTHGALSQVAVSERVVTVDNYWLPEDLEERANKMPPNHHDLTASIQEQGFTHDFTIEQLLNMSPLEAQKWFKELGYSKELFQRWPNHMKIKEWIIGGWLQDPHTWSHLLIERSAYPELYKNWTQETTKQVAVLIREVLEEYIKNNYIEGISIE